MKQLVFLVLLFFTNLLFAQQKLDFKVHSHNDYLRNVPFWEAYSVPCQSIEVDVILKGGQLMVGHEVESIQPQNTLDALYLRPIQKAKAMNAGKNPNFQLLIDLKTEAYSTLELLVQQLEPYEALWASPSNLDGVKIVISGSRPQPEDYTNYPDYIYFDYQSQDLDGDLPWDRIAMVSYSFRTVSIWNGKGRMVEADRQKALDLIGKVHEKDKPIRFWATPDSKTAWKALQDMQVDFINTDQPHLAFEYLSKLPKWEYKGEIGHQVKPPKFEVDGVEQPVRRIILMIGDGNGLGQIAAAQTVNGNKLFLTQIINIGLIKTQAADDYTTDSAAGATAFASGQKTNNRFIGILPNGEKAEHLPDILKSMGWKNGLITTDKMAGATPSAFYAHVRERDDTQAILDFLPESSLDFFAGGGKDDFTRFGKNQLETLEENGYELLDNFEGIRTSESDKIGFLAASGSLPSILQNRGDYLKNTTIAAMDFLGRDDSPFFLMLESAFIDSGGHSNSTEVIVEEMLDFDQTIGAVLDYADANPGTLVLITADHETGGVTLPQGSIADHRIELNYQSDDHTGIMVPIFAYGAHSGDFRGVYENTEVFHRILHLVKRDRVE